jgi:hypothetical protein
MIELVIGRLLEREETVSSRVAPASVCARRVTTPLASLLKAEVVKCESRFVFLGCA